ncbi:MAG: hypothetical protein AAF519_19920, partial [Bacteroidota bacterium]
EYATATIFLVCGVVAIFRAKKVATYRFIRLLIPLVLIFIALEEISYGQRIFQFNNPEVLEEFNVQNEFNLHNLSIVHHYLVPGLVFFFLISLSYFSLYPAQLQRKLQIFSVDRYILPYFLWLGVVMAIVYLKLFYFTDLLYFIEIIDVETAEFTFSVGVLVWTKKVYLTP